jgi:hypothetical protein
MAVTRPINLETVQVARRGTVYISGAITITAAGAISAVACEYAPLFAGAAGLQGTILKDAAAGRYNVTLLRKFRGALRLVSCSLTNPSATVAQGNTNGNAVTFRPSATQVAGQTFSIQAFLASSGADTDVITGTIISFLVEAQVL